MHNKWHKSRCRKPKCEQKAKTYLHNTFHVIELRYQLMCIWKTPVPWEKGGLVHFFHIWNNRFSLQSDKQHVESLIAEFQINVCLWVRAQEWRIITRNTQFSLHLAGIPKLGWNFCYCLANIFYLFDEYKSIDFLLSWRSKSILTFS